MPKVKKKKSKLLKKLKGKNLTRKAWEKLVARLKKAMKLELTEADKKLLTRLRATGDNAPVTRSYRVVRQLSSDRARKYLMDFFRNMSNFRSSAVDIDLTGGETGPFNFVETIRPNNPNRENVRREPVIARVVPNIKKEKKKKKVKRGGGETPRNLIRNYTRVMRDPGYNTPSSTQIRVGKLPTPNQLTYTEAKNATLSSSEKPPTRYVNYLTPNQKLTPASLKAFSENETVKK